MKMLIKKYFYIAGLIIIAYFTISLKLFGQSAITILEKSYKECQKIKSGFYEMSGIIKFLTGKDTVLITSKCHFKKIMDDSIFPVKFHYFIGFNGDLPGEVLYTGEEIINTNPKDSTGIIRSRAKWEKNIKANRGTYLFFEPFIDQGVFPFFLDSTHLKSNIEIKEVFNDIDSQQLYYHFKIIVPSEQSYYGSEMKPLSDIYEYWISKYNFLPCQYSLTQKFVQRNDTLVQYRSYQITNLLINNIFNDSIFEVSSLPRHFRYSNFELPKNDPLISSGSNAPNWTLMTLSGEKKSLKDFAGNVVLLDFFYKSCYPCLLSLPHLIDLFNKYNDHGLVILGIDPIDKNFDELGSFLSGKGVTYPILIGTKEVIKDYRVTSYPTIYLIGKDGKILFHLSGYGIGSEEVIENFIVQSLQ